MEKSMKLNKQMRLIKLIAIVGLFGHSAASLAATAAFDENVAIDGAAIIDVSNQSGAVNVRGGDVDQVSIHARITVNKRLSKTDPLKAGNILRAIKSSPPIEIDGNKVVIGELKKHNHKRYVSISYEIVVPRDAEVNVHSISGNVHVSGVTGAVKATSDTGKVTLAGLSKPQKAQTTG